MNSRKHDGEEEEEEEDITPSLSEEMSKKFETFLTSTFGTDESRKKMMRKLENSRKIKMLKQYEKRSKKEGTGSEKSFQERFETFLTANFPKDESKKEMMRKLEKSRQQMMLTQWEKMQSEKEVVSIRDRPMFFLMELSSCAMDSKKSEMEKAKVLQNLYFNLRTKKYSWVLEFTKMKGFQKLFCVFVVYNSKFGRKTPFEKDIIKNCILSTVLLFDSSKEGFNQFVNTPNSVREFAHALRSEDSEVRWKVLYLLTAVAIKSDDLFNLVLDAMNNVRLVRRDKYCFEIIVTMLKRDKKFENKLYCLTFLNVMIAKPKSLMTRNQTIEDLEAMGIEKIMVRIDQDITKFKSNLKDVQAKQIMDSISNQILLLQETFKNYRTTKTSKSLEQDDDVHAAFDMVLLGIGDNSEKKKYMNVLLHNIAKRMKKGINDNEWEELLDTSSGKMSNLALTDRNKILQAQVTELKLEKYKQSKEQIEGVQKMVAMMEYVKALKRSCKSVQTPKPKPANNPVTKSLFELVSSLKAERVETTDRDVETKMEIESLKGMVDEKTKAIVELRKKNAALQLKNLLNE